MAKASYTKKKAAYNKKQRPEEAESNHNKLMGETTPARSSSRSSSGAIPPCKLPLHLRSWCGAIPADIIADGGN